MALTAQALLESETASSEVPQDLLDFSPLAASRDLLPLLQDADATLDRGQIQQLLEDEDLSAQVCLKLLGEVRNYPKLADRVAEAYDAKAGVMAVPEMLLLTGALVILAIRIKEIRWSKKEKVIQFEKAGEVAKSFVIGLIKSGGGGG
ncbi:MAG: hypothetical protein ACE5JA_09110 [bacterium]